MTNSTEEESRLYQVLTEHIEWAPIVDEALETERAGREQADQSEYKYDYLGWEWYEVSVDPKTLNTMVTSRVLKITHKSHSSTYYMVRNPEAASKVISILNKPVEHPIVEEKIPSDIFSSIVGHNDKKIILKYAIESEKPTHILLRGVPASGKTLFLLELCRLPNTSYTLGPSLSEAGLADLLFISQPNFLIIDEIDRLSGQNLGVLNSLMATGVVCETKYRKTRSITLGTKVFAAGVRAERLPKDLWTRFVKLNFPTYSSQQFMEVTVGILAREGISPDDASYIGEQVWNMDTVNADIRQCVYIARLSKENGSTSKRIREVTRILRENKKTIPSI